MPLFFMLAIATGRVSTCACNTAHISHPVPIRIAPRGQLRLYAEWPARSSGMGSVLRGTTCRPAAWLLSCAMRSHK